MARAILREAAGYRAVNVKRGRNPDGADRAGRPYGPTVKVGGHSRSSPAIPPATGTDLIAPSLAYHDWVAAGLASLVSHKLGPGLVTDS